MKTLRDPVYVGGLRGWICEALDDEGNVAGMSAGEDDLESRCNARNELLNADEVAYDRNEQYNRNSQVHADSRITPHVRPQVRPWGLNSRITAKIY